MQIAYSSKCPQFLSYCYHFLFARNMLVLKEIKRIGIKRVRVNWRQFKLKMCTVKLDEDWGIVNSIGRRVIANLFAAVESQIKISSLSLFTFNMDL